MSSLHLEILTMDREFYRGDIYEIIVPAHDGYRGFRHGHAPYLTILGSGSVKLKLSGTDSKFKSYLLNGGFLEVTQHGVTLFADEITEDTGAIPVNL